MRPAVVDTNVVVSGVLTDQEEAATRRLVDRMLHGAVPFHLSVALLSEYRDVLLRPKITSLHGLSEEEVDAVLEEFALHAIFQDPGAAEEDAPDSGDQHLWNLLSCVTGAVLVTGDRELLEHSPAEHSVVGPDAYLKLIDD